MNDRTNLYLVLYLTSMMDRKLCPPWGLFGGGEAQHCELTVKTKNKNYKKL